MVNLARAELVILSLVAAGVDTMAGVVVQTVAVVVEVVILTQH
jgi:hypothetical protein